MYSMALDNSWAIMNEEEMYDVNGGLSFWQKTGIIAAFAANVALLTVAIAYFQFWLGATIMKLSIGAFITKLGAIAVATVVAESFGVSLTATIKLFEFIS